MKFLLGILESIVFDFTTELNSIARTKGLVEVNTEQKKYNQFEASEIIYLNASLDQTSMHLLAWNVSKSYIVVKFG